MFGRSVFWKGNPQRHNWTTFLPGGGAKPNFIPKNEANTNIGAQLDVSSPIVRFIKKENSAFSNCEKQSMK